MASMCAGRVSHLSNAETILPSVVVVLTKGRQVVVERSRQIAK
jgi:hypothetical protein